MAGVTTAAGAMGMGALLHLSLPIYQALPLDQAASNGRGPGICSRPQTWPGYAATAWPWARSQQLAPSQWLVFVQATFGRIIYRLLEVMY